LFKAVNVVAIVFPPLIDSRAARQPVSDNDGEKIRANLLNAIIDADVLEHGINFS
jgi:hypothetical protein